MECEKHRCCNNAHHDKAEDMMKFNSGDMMTDWFVKKADEAWNDLFIEKAKAHWEKLHGKKMDEMAAAAVKANFDNHMNMSESGKTKSMAVKKMHEIMG